MFIAPSKMNHDGALFNKFKRYSNVHYSKSQNSITTNEEDAIWVERIETASEVSK